MEKYTVKFERYESFACFNANGDYIIVEALGFPFEIGNQILVDEFENVFTVLGKETCAMVQQRTSKNGAIDHLNSLR